MTTPDPTTPPVDSAKQAFQSALKEKMGVGVSEMEKSLWSGGYSPKAMIGTWILVAGLSIVAAIACSMLVSQANVPSSNVWLIGGGVVIGAWVVAISTYIYRRFGVHYELTNQRFIHKHGILVRTTDRIEVIDIDDVTYSQGLVQRMLGVGNIVLSSSDRTHPKLFLLGIDRVNKISGLIDDTRRNERRRRSVHIEQG